MVLGVEKVGHHHETKLAILVRLGTDETVAICHRDRIYKACLESIQIMQIGDGVNATSANSIVVSSNRADHDDASVWRVDHAFHELADHQEMRKEVDLHSLLMIVSAPLGMVERRLVDASITDKAIDGLGHAKFIQVLAKIANRLKRVQFTFHGCEVFRIKTINLCDCLHLVNVTNCANDMILSGPKQGQRSFST